MEHVIGICSQCGGQVKQHTGPWYGVNPPTPRCSSCGAGPALPVIRMGQSTDFRELPKESQQEYFGINKK